jgi:membrane-bound serine protease (ClpP class)
MRWLCLICWFCCYALSAQTPSDTQPEKASSRAPSSSSSAAASSNAPSNDAPSNDVKSPQDYGKVGYASLTGPIDRLRHRYLVRMINDARARKLDTVIVHIDTDGGEVSHAREMFKKVIDQARDGPRMIAFIDFRSISAGAMISYAHEEIYISPSASIGDIGVIFVGRDGEIKYAPEKIETVIRSLLLQAAELRGWDRALLLKMTARTQKLYRVNLPDGTGRYVIEDELPELLAQYPSIDPENRSQVWVYRGEDRLLTMTGQEAVKLGMATALVDDLDALYQKLGIESADVVDLQPHTAELTAWHLATVAPLLAGLAFLFIMFELKTPGVGLWALLALICGAGFLLSQYYLDMAENIEVVLILVGILLLGADALLGIGGGMLALAGAGMAFFGLLMSFVPNELEFDLSDEQFQRALGEAALSSLISIAVVAAGVVILTTWMSRVRLSPQVAMTAAIDGTSAGPLETDAQALIGSIGTTRELLKPSGIVDLNSRGQSARAQHGAYIGAGLRVEVVGIEFGELVVRERIEPNAVPTAQHT